MYDLYKEPDIVTAIRQGRIRWAGHVLRMTEERAMKKVFIRGPGGGRARGRPRRRWVDDIDEDMRRLEGSEGGEVSHRIETDSYTHLLMDPQHLAEGSFPKDEKSIYESFLCKHVQLHCPAIHRKPIDVHFFGLHALCWCGFRHFPFKKRANVSK